MPENKDRSELAELDSDSNPPLTLFSSKGKSDEDSPYDKNEISRLWQMRWCFFWVSIILSIFWMLAMLGLSVYIFSLTKSFFCLFISAASTLGVEMIRRFASYLLPMDDKTFELKKIKMQMKLRK